MKIFGFLALLTTVVIISIMSCKAREATTPIPMPVEPIEPPVVPEEPQTQPAKPVLDPIDTFTMVPYQVIVFSTERKQGADSELIIVRLALRYPSARTIEYYLTGYNVTTGSVIDCSNEIPERPDSDLWMATTEAAERFLQKKQKPYYSK